MNVLAEKVIAATGSTSPIRHISYEDAYGPGFEDMDRRVPDVSKAKQSFGYTPTHSLSDIVMSVVDYYREKLELSTPAATTRQMLSMAGDPLPAAPLSSTGASFAV